MKQVYIITRERLPDGTWRITRRNIGFNVHELLGLMEESQLDIIERVRGNVKPDVVVRIAHDTIGETRPARLGARHGK